MMLGLQKRGQSAAAAAAAAAIDDPAKHSSNQNEQSLSPNGKQHVTSQTPLRQSVKIVIQPPQASFPSPHRVQRKTSKNQGNSLFIMPILLCTFFTMLTLMHQTINQFELESKQQSHLLRKTIDNLLFDYKALPQYSNLHGKYTGCQLLNGMLAPHNYKDAVFVDKELDIVNGSGTNLVNRYRLHDYDYDEVKGLVAGFNNAFVFGAEPIVYDCHVKFRPGGANALNLDGFGVALDGITMKQDDGGGGAVTNHPQIDIINGTAILIAQYWGE
jgi:hypothetical protein